VKLSQPLTHVVENFRHTVNEMEAEGDTALWDALALANDQLSEYGKKFPEAKRRIICLSDGADNKSLKRAEEVGGSIFVCTSRHHSISRRRMDRQQR
jgi:Mg-chelatase subunit ChlD